MADPFPPVPERQAGYAELSRRFSERGDFDEGSKTISGMRPRTEFACFPSNATLRELEQILIIRDRILRL